MDSDVFLCYRWKLWGDMQRLSAALWENKSTLPVRSVSPFCCNLNSLIWMRRCGMFLLEWGRNCSKLKLWYHVGTLFKKTHISSRLGYERWGVVEGKERETSRSGLINHLCFSFEFFLFPPFLPLFLILNHNHHDDLSRFPGAWSCLILIHLELNIGKKRRLL